MTSVLDPDNVSVSQRTTVWNISLSTNESLNLLLGFFTVLIFNEIAENIRDLVRQNYRMVLSSGKSALFEIYEAMHDPYKLFVHVLSNKSIAGVPNDNRSDDQKWIWEEPIRDYLRKRRRGMKRVAIAFIAFIITIGMEVLFVWVSNRSATSVDLADVSRITWRSEQNASVTSANLVRGSYSRAIPLTERKERVEFTRLPSISVERTDFENAFEGIPETTLTGSRQFDDLPAVNCTGSEDWRFKCQFRTKSHFYQYKVRLEHSIEEKLIFYDVKDIGFGLAGKLSIAAKIQPLLKEKFNLTFNFDLNEPGKAMVSQEKGVNIADKVRVENVDVLVIDVIGTAILSTIVINTETTSDPVLVREPERRTPQPMGAEGVIGASNIPRMPLILAIIIYFGITILFGAIKNYTQLGAFNAETLAVFEAVNANCSASLLSVEDRVLRKVTHFFGTKSDEGYQGDPEEEHHGHVGYQRLDEPGIIQTNQMFIPGFQYRGLKSCAKLSSFERDKVDVLQLLQMKATGKYSCFHDCFSQVKSNEQVTWDRPIYLSETYPRFKLAAASVHGKTKLCCVDTETDRFGLVSVSGNCLHLSRCDDKYEDLDIFEDAAQHCLDLGFGLHRFGSGRKKLKWEELIDDVMSNRVPKVAPLHGTSYREQGELRSYLYETTAKNDNPVMRPSTYQDILFRSGIPREYMSWSTYLAVISYAKGNLPRKSIFFKHIDRELLSMQMKDTYEDDILSIPIARHSLKWDENGTLVRQVRERRYRFVLNEVGMQGVVPTVAGHVESENNVEPPTEIKSAREFCELIFGKKMHQAEVNTSHGVVEYFSFPNDVRRTCLGALIFASIVKGRCKLTGVSCGINGAACVNDSPKQTIKMNVKVPARFLVYNKDVYELRSVEEQQRRKEEMCKGTHKDEGFSPSEFVLNETSTSQNAWVM